MLVIYGEKDLQRRAGYVAERCPSCARAQPIEVLRNSRTLHFFFIPLGRGQFLSAVGRCRACHSEFPIELSDYSCIEKRPDGDLTARTNPKLDDRSGRLQEAHMRFAAIRAPFLEHASRLNLELFKATRFDRTSTLAFLGAFALPFLLGYALSFVPKSADAGVATVNYLILLFLIAFCAAVVVFFRGPRRVINREVIPRIVSDLQPLQPSEEEIEDVLKALRKSGERLVHFIKTPAVTYALRQNKEVGSSKPGCTDKM